MSHYNNSLFIPIDSHSGANRNSNNSFVDKSEILAQTYFKKPQESSPQSITDARLTPSSTPTIVSSSVFPRSASEALFDSSSKFRQLPCRTFISVGTCPYRERCVYLHDPRCICREAKTKTRRKNKEDVVVDALFWPVMPCSLVNGKLDANRQPHVIQSYSVPVPQQDHYRSHDQAVYSCWMHFVDFCLANSESQGPLTGGTAPCFQAPDLPVNAYTDKERLQIFRELARTGSSDSAQKTAEVSVAQNHSSSSHDFNSNQQRSTSCSPASQPAALNGFSRPQQFTAPNDIRNLQYPVLNQPASNGGGSGYGKPAHGGFGGSNALLALYAESNPHAHNGFNSAMVPQVTVPAAPQMMHQNAHHHANHHPMSNYYQQMQQPPQHRFSPQHQAPDHYRCLTPDYQRFDAQQTHQYFSPSPISIAEKGSPAAIHADKNLVKKPFPHFPPSARSMDSYSSPNTHNNEGFEHSFRPAYSMDEQQGSRWMSASRSLLERDGVMDSGSNEWSSSANECHMMEPELYSAQCTTPTMSHKTSQRLSADAPPFRFGGGLSGVRA